MLDLDLKDYLRLAGWILVFLFPVWVVYKTGGPDKEPLLDDVEYQRQARLKKLAEQKKRAVGPEAAANNNNNNNNNNAAKVTTMRNRKKNKKNKAATAEANGRDANSTVSKATDDKQKTHSGPDQQQTRQSKKDKKKKTAKSTENNDDNSSKQALSDAVQAQDSNEGYESVKEIDEHMDPTVRYARVMRIKPEEDELELEAVPFEEGWSQVKSRRLNQKANTSSSSTYIDRNSASAAAVLEANERYIPGLDKKQRENMKRNAKKKAQKQAAVALQEERLRKHMKELEKVKIQEYYATGKGKNTPWGKNGQKSSSSKVPQSTAGVNEYGQLIWD